jgi:putative transposase
MPAALKIKLSLEEDKRLLENCSEMNPIELEWLHLKRDHLSGQMFDSEDNLMWGIEDPLLSRYDSLGFDTSYFEFSYA